MLPSSAWRPELLFEVFSQRYERGATIVTSNLPFDEWTSVFGSERLTGFLRGTPLYIKLMEIQRNRAFPRQIESSLSFSMLPTGTL